jgi:Lysine methyltransferase
VNCFMENGACLFIPIPLAISLELRCLMREITSRILYWVQSRILELGSGTGVLGMAVSKMCHSLYPPACVVLTDGDATAIDLLRSSLLDPANQIDSSIVQAALLKWGTGSDGNAESSFVQWCHSGFNVWHETDDVVFDCIMAGDVLYKSNLPTIFFATARALLFKSRRSCLWLCHIPRHGVTQEQVVQVAESTGFAVEVVDPPINSVRGCPLDDLSRAVLYRMRLQC